jgi:hypothetical protein
MQALISFSHPQVPAMYVKQPFHVQQFFDRAADHGSLAIGE